ncbi:MAG: hypothetical protein WDO73_23000 [Ignavibacteriota bacterium]
MRWLRELTVGLVGLSLWSARNPVASPQIADFQKRVADYVALRKTAASNVSGLKTSGSPEKIQQHQKDLSAAIRSARPAAAQGDIFTPPVAAEFCRLIQATLSTPGAERVKKGVKDTQLSTLPQIRVNDTYPADQPVQSMPPSLLKQLPELPKELEYRVVGRALILRDVEANLIVDYINEALP